LGGGLGGGEGGGESRRQPFGRAKGKCQVGEVGKKKVEVTVVGAEF